MINTIRESIPFLAKTPEQRRFDELMDKIPGSDSPLELVDMIRTPIAYLHDHWEKYGAVARTRLIFPAVWVFGPEAMKTVFVTKRHSFSYEKGYGKLAFGQLFPGSIILQDGDMAAATRDILMPAVGRLGIRESNQKVQEIWTNETRTLDDNVSRDIYDFVHQTTFKVSAHALTGLELDDELDEMFPLFEALIDGAIQSVPFPYPLGLGPLSKGIKARHELIKRLTPRIEAIRRNGDQSGMVGLLAHHRDENGDLLDVEEVIRHLMLLFWAGYDTTASAGSWCLHLLAHNPIWQERLRDEAAEVLGDKDFDLNAVAGLEQLSWFLREQERHRPSIVMFTRETVEEVEVGGYTLPKGVSLMYSPYMTHHMETLFDQPNVFDPERWNPARGEKAAKAANLIGFGGGPRLCIGRNFALMQLRVLITTILRDYSLEPDPRYDYTRMALPMHRPVNSRIYFRRLKK